MNIFVYPPGYQGHVEWCFPVAQMLKGEDADQVDPDTYITPDRIAASSPVMGHIGAVGSPDAVYMNSGMEVLPLSKQNVAFAPNVRAWRYSLCKNRLWHLP